MYGLSRVELVFTSNAGFYNTLLDETWESIKRDTNLSMDKRLSYMKDAIRHLEYLGAIIKK